MSNASIVSPVASSLDDELRLVPGDRLVVVFTQELKAAAVRLTVSARRSGAAVRLAASPSWDGPTLGGRVRSAFRELERELERESEREVEGEIEGDSGRGPGGGRRLVLFVGGEPVDLPRLAIQSVPATASGLLVAQLTSDAAVSADRETWSERLAMLRDGVEGDASLVLTSGAGRELRLVRRLDGAPVVGADVVGAHGLAAGVVTQLPSGHVEFEVSDAEGEFVAEGALCSNRPVRLGGSLAGRPVRMQVAAGRVTGIDCPDDPHTEGFLRRAVTVHGVTRLRLARLRPPGRDRGDGRDGRTEVQLCLTAEDGATGPAADLRIVLGTHATWRSRATRSRTADPSEAERN